MLRTHVHKLAWARVTIKILMASTLLMPRVGWAQCRCSVDCAATTDAGLASPKTKPAETRCPCCPDAGPSCCCCLSEAEAAKPEAKSESEKPAVPDATTPDDGHCHSAGADQRFAAVQATLVEAGEQLDSQCSHCQGNCRCRIVEMEWTSPVPLTPRAAQLDQPLALDGADQAPAVFARATSTFLVRCSGPPVSAPLQVLLCRWLI